jgi:tRNA-dihydrouridine synthase B
MVGRGSYGRPWFMGQVKHYLATGQRLPSPSIAEQYAVVREHYDAMLEHYGIEGGLRVARKHLAWYSKGLPGSAEFRSSVMKIDDVDTVKRTLREYYEPLLERQAA